MSNTVKIKRSNTTGAVPSLVDGQIAINQKDKKFFYLDHNGVLQSFDLDGFVASKIRAILGITTLSGSNTGDDTVVKDTPNTVVTGTTLNTILTSFLIPANTFSLSDQFKIDMQVEKVGSANGWNIRTYINTTNSLTGAQLLSTVTLTLSQLSASIRRCHTIKGGQMFVYPASTSSITDIAASGATSVVNYNTTTDVFFIIALQMNGTTDIGSVNSYNIKKG